MTRELARLQTNVDFDYFNQIHGGDTQSPNAPTNEENNDGTEPEIPDLTIVESEEEATRPQWAAPAIKKKVHWKDPLTEICYFMADDSYPPQVVRKCWNPNVSRTLSANTLIVGQEKVQHFCNSCAILTALEKDTPQA